MIEINGQTFISLREIHAIFDSDNPDGEIDIDVITQLTLALEKHGGTVYLQYKGRGIEIYDEFPASESLRISGLVAAVPPSHWKQGFELALLFFYEEEPIEYCSTSKSTLIDGSLQDTEDRRLKLNSPVDPVPENLWFSRDQIDSIWEQLKLSPPVESGPEQAKGAWQPINPPKGIRELSLLMYELINEIKRIPKSREEWVREIVKHYGPQHGYAMASSRGESMIQEQPDGSLIVISHDMMYERIKLLNKHVQTLLLESQKPN